MPTDRLNKNSDLNEVIEWLNENLITPPIVPEVNNLLLIPEHRGIYFWFMRKEGYDALSSFITLQQLEYKFIKIIDKFEYHLVYLGTAGTGKKRESNLRERLRWHINQAHSKSSVCSGTLSTLRAGVGTLISEDLILPNTEVLVNDLFRDYFKVMWIDYSDYCEGVFNIINRDEKVLIKQLKPLLNIKNNPNAKSNALINPTKLYRQRRNLVYNASRARLNCGSNPNNNVQGNQENIPIEPPPSYQHQIIEESRNISEQILSIEFTVLKEQSIADVINGIEGLPTSEVKILLYDSLNPENLVYASQRNEGWRVTGRNLEQNIYSFFLAPDTAKDNIPKWKVVQNEMIESSIEEITVIIN